MRFKGVNLSGIDNNVIAPRSIQTVRVTGSSATTVVAWNRRPAKGNLLLLIACCQQNRTISVSGWTQIYYTNLGNIPVALFWKIATSDEATSNNVVYSGSVNALVYAFEIAGQADFGTPFTYTPMNYSGSGVNSIAVPNSGATINKKTYVIAFVNQQSTKSGWSVNNSFTLVNSTNSWGKAAYRTYNTKEIGQQVTFSWSTVSSEVSTLAIFIPPKRIVE